MDIRTLQYWHKLEHFYPYLLQPQKSEAIKTFLISDGTTFLDFERPRVEPGKRVRKYCVYLGIFKVAPALGALEEGIGSKMRFRDSGDDESCFCMFQLAPDGTIQPDSFRVSSFPWAIHRVRDGKIYIDHWDEDFFQFQKQLFAAIEEREGPVDLQYLRALRDLFASRINWKIDYCGNWLRIDRIIGREPSGGKPRSVKEETEDELPEEEEIVAEDESTDEQVKKNDLLNSFYIRDLERVIGGVQAGKYPESFRLFLEHNTGGRVDIERNEEAMFQLMSPNDLPRGRWPSDYGARLMQQVDVNAFLTGDEKYRQILFSVNGPPGTGKTTLLKDVVAAIVTERAHALLTLERPNDAFEPQPLDAIAYKDKQYAVWRLRPEFSKFGILVASNNNGAVENITHGLPARKDLPKQYDAEEYHYFAQVSDRLLGEGQTWALNAVALGNKKNRSNFIQNFWPINEEEAEPYNLREVLWGSTRSFAKDTWDTARQAFSEKWAAVEEEICRIQETYDAAGSLRAMLRELDGAEREIPELEAELSAWKVKEKTARADLERAETKRRALEDEVRYLISTTPLMTLREIICPRSPAVVELNERRAQRKEAAEAAGAFKAVWEGAKQEIARLNYALTGKREVLRQGHNSVENFRSKLETFRQETGQAFRVDEYFEDCGAGEHGKSSPWGYQRLNELREQLFLAALELHRVFVEGSSRLRDDLDGFNKLMRGMLPAAQADSLTAPLLQSLFLMVPVVSTTFASVGTFLRAVPAGEIAYLFIDEAGQAVPQSAAGAIWRARKVIAVGDPLQIEPVVTLHDAVVEALGRHFQQETVLMDKYTSVQTLADQANRLGGWREINKPGDLWIGAPLVVHSRCQRRVFEIANRIAYNRKMIFDTRERAGAVCRWLDVRGNSQNGHYVPAQAEAAMELVGRAFARFATGGEQGKYPSLFVITPFRSSRVGLSAFFRRELPKCLEQSGVDPREPTLHKAIQNWLRECVGTIHTFQGKEADTVLLCLGVDSGGKGVGAVDWAGERPNILNVAVTRAKEKLYIIADRAVWCRKGYFQTAWELCEKGDAGYCE